MPDAWKMSAPVAKTIPARSIFVPSGMVRKLFVGGAIKIKPADGVTIKLIMLRILAQPFAKKKVEIYC